MRRHLRSGLTALALIPAAAPAFVAAGCGTNAPATDPLAAVPCAAWQPSSADWSSVATARPVSLGAVSASPSGRYLYSVGTWFDAGVANRRILRSPDLGASWCVLATPDPIALVAPSGAKETVLYALTCPQAGTAMQMLRSVDGGGTWTTAAASVPGAAADCPADFSRLETSATDAGAVWLTQVDSTEHSGNAVFISRDQGETWRAPVPGDLVATDADNNGPDVFIARIPEGFVVDPASPDRLVAWGSIQTLDINATPDLTSERRWFASDDAGQTWSSIAAPDDPSSAIGFADAASSLYAFANGRLFRSPDWGRTWGAVTLPDPISTPTLLGSRVAGDLFAWRADSGAADVPTVWRSADGGATWRALAGPDDPAVTPVLAARGRDVIVGRDRLGFSSSPDGGRTWTHGPSIPQPLDLLQSRADAGRIWTSPLDPSARGSSTPALLRSDDGGLTFTVLPAPGLPTLLLDDAATNVAFAGLASDSGGADPMRTEDGGKTWVTVPATPSRLAAATCPAPMSCLYVLGADLQTTHVAYSTDHGRTWVTRLAPYELAFGAPTIAVVPDSAEHLLAACLVSPDDTAAICETRDGGQSWTTHVLGTNAGHFVVSIVIPADGVALAATTQVPSNLNDPLPGAVARSTDGGSTWSIVANMGGHLIASHAHPETVFLISDDSSTPTVYRSDDSGLTWRPVLTPGGAAQPWSRPPVLSAHAIADAPTGGFLAATAYGLVRFE